MTAPHVGMTVWKYNPNKRVYQFDANGRAVGSPIWRESWELLKIIGETSRSWIIGPEWMASDLGRGEKIAKREWPGSIALSVEDIDRRAFVEKAHQLARRVGNCKDYDTLKKIEAALDAQL